MIKRLLLMVTFLSTIGFTASAQTFNVALNYQSFRPFIHFRLELGNGPRAYDPYQASYIRGYMDGANARYYNGSPYYERDRLSEAYDTGYQDGILDRELYCQLQGVRRLSRRPFAYDDYYAPYYSIQIWLNQVSFTFLRAPDHRLPHNWAHRAHHDLIGYRRRVHQNRQWAHVEKQYRNRINHLQSRAHEVQRSRRQQGVSRVGKRPSRVSQTKQRQHLQTHRVQHSNESRSHRADRSKNSSTRVKRQKRHPSSQPKHTRSRRTSRPSHKSTPHKVRSHSRSTSHHKKARSRSHTKNKSRSRSGHRNDN